MDDLCGRATKRGTACKSHRSAYPSMTFDFTTFDPSYAVDLLPACRTHLTDVERAALEARETAVASEKAAAAERWLALDPACWGWPAPDDLESLLPDLSGYNDSTRARMEKAWVHPDDGGEWRICEWHRGRCAICGIGEDLVVDHDHETGLVRGHLCQSCNVREGMDRRAEGMFAKYRRRNPASILGIRARYLHPRTGEYAEPMPQVVPAWEDSLLRGLGL